MNLRVASGAVTERLEALSAMRNVDAGRRHVTLKAQRSLFTAREQRLVGAAMRRMAGCAALHLYGGVFECPGTALFSVASHAGLPVGLHQRGAVVAAVCRVAVRAFHSAFRYAVMLRQGERRSDVGVALVAQFRLALLKQAVV